MGYYISRIANRLDAVWVVLIHSFSALLDLECRWKKRDKLLFACFVVVLQCMRRRRFHMRSKRERGEQTGRGFLPGLEWAYVEVSVILCGRADIQDSVCDRCAI